MPLARYLSATRSPGGNVEKNVELRKGKCGGSRPTWPLSLSPLLSCLFPHRSPVLPLFCLGARDFLCLGRERARVPITIHWASVCVLCVICVRNKLQTLNPPHSHPSHPANGFAWIVTPLTLPSTLGLSPWPTGTFSIRSSVSHPSRTWPKDTNFPSREGCAL